MGFRISEFGVRTGGTAGRATGWKDQWSVDVGFGSSAVATLAANNRTTAMEQVRFIDDSSLPRESPRASHVRESNLSAATRRLCGARFSLDWVPCPPLWVGISQACPPKAVGMAP